MDDRDPRSDLELVDAANRGDPAAFEALYRRHRDWVLSLAWRFTGNSHDALDVLQETFTYLLRKFPGFRLTASLRTLLYVAVRNRSIDVRRRRQRSVGGARVDLMAQNPLETAQDPGLSAQNTASSAQRTDLSDLKIALGGLAPAHREILLMRFVDDLDLKEIAEALDVPLGTVKSRLHAALEALRHDARARDYFS